MIQFDNTNSVKLKAELAQLIHGNEGIPNAPLLRPNVVDYAIKQGDRIVITSDRSLLRKGVTGEVTSVIERYPMTRIIVSGLTVFGGEYEKIS